MKKFNKILKAILFPHNAIIILLVPVATVLLIYSFASGSVNPIVAYTSYFLSAYTLTIVCAKTAKIVEAVKKFKQNNKYANLYTNDAQLRVKISLYGSVVWNLLYSLLQLGLGIYNHSVWFYALSGYYALLSIMRFFLLKETRKNLLGKNTFRELLHYRFCGILLLLMNITLGAITAYIVWQNKGFEHHYIVTIAMAAYTFTAITMATVNIFKYRKYNSPVMSASKIVSLISAMVSMLSLETAMLSAFGENNGEEFRRTMTAFTGGAVCVTVLVMAIFMIVKSTKQIKAMKQGEQNG